MANSFEDLDVWKAGCRLAVSVTKEFCPPWPDDTGSHIHPQQYCGGFGTKDSERFSLFRSCCIRFSCWTENTNIYSPFNGHHFKRAGRL